MQAQVVKQTDVLMLHHLVPDEVAPGSLEANLDHYEPRTAHGSSLSPGTHAALLARAGRFEAALDALDDDRLPGSRRPDPHRRGRAAHPDDGRPVAGAGVRVRRASGRPGDALAIDPRLPPAGACWRSRSGSGVGGSARRIEHDAMTLRAADR